MADRLDAFLSHRGFGSRSQVRGLVRSGAVSLDGKTCRDQAARVEGRVVSVDGQVVPVGASSATLLLNKPLGYACSHDRDERAPLLEESSIPQGLRATSRSQSAPAASTATTPRPAHASPPIAT